MQSAPSATLGRAQQPHRVPPRRRSPPAKRRRASSPYSSHSSLSSPHASPSTSPPPTASTTVASAADPVIPANSVSTPSPAAAKWFRKPSVVWYRGHDLRVEDHPALLAAAQRGGPVVPFFVWDPSDGFGESLGTTKQWWLRESLLHLQRDLRRLGVQLYTRTGRSTNELRAFLDETGADAVFWNRCYEPNLLKRDEELRVELAQEGLTAESFKAELLVEPWELSHTDTSPCFETFHAYMRAWMTVPPPPQPFPCPSRLRPISPAVKMTDIDELGLEIHPLVHEKMSKVWVPGSSQAKLHLDKFLHEVFPAFGEGRCRRHTDGTSRLSPHIRFGELSPRRMYHATRLRVARWDQASTRSVSNLAMPGGTRRSNLSSKAVASTIKKVRKQHSNGNLEDGTVPNGKVKEPNGLLRQGKLQNGSVDPQRPLIEDGSNTHLSKKRTIVSKKRQYTLARRPGLPHISLSARAFLKNLCLRDFSYHVLFHNPEVNVKPLIPQFASFPWAEDNGSFASWLGGKTGYPIVDAAMRELRETGWIHNGMRFLLACFLTKYLLLPWAKGLREFYKLLVDGDHSSNALGWQWTAGSNTDAFPVSCLVNPVTAAYRHDPTGSYVRRWLPELARLPNEYLHQPWKAPVDALKSAGIELGKTYPDRIVTVGEARSRAHGAMRVMKRIFSGSRVLRNVFKSNDKALVKEWPDEQPEISNLDEALAFTGKMSLLPSLWALLQCDQPSTYLAGTTPGSDPLIAWDTASLAEGALAVPLDDQHESIEHALIAAREQDSSRPGFAGDMDTMALGDRVLETPSANPGISSDTDEAHTMTRDGNGSAVEALEGLSKYSSAEENSFGDSQKVPSASHSHIPVIIKSQSGQGSDGQNLNQVQDRAQQQRRDEHVHQIPAGQMPLDGAQVPYGQQPQQHFQQFHQLQQLQQFHQMQQIHMQQQQHQPPMHSRPGHPPQAHQFPHSLQQHQARVHSMVDGLYANSSNTPVTGNAGAGVPIGAHLMMPPSTSAAEVPVHPMFQNNDANGAMYGHHLGMGQYYGFQQVMPMMNSHSINGSDRPDNAGSGGTANGPKQMGASGMLPMGYGMYGGNMFDHNVLSNSFSPNGGGYGRMPGTTQQQSHGGPQPGYNVPHHPSYFSATGGPGMSQSPAQVPRPPPGAPLGSLHSNPFSGLSPETNVNVAAAAAAAVAAGSREVANNAKVQKQSAKRYPRGVETPSSIDEQNLWYLHGTLKGTEHGVLAGSSNAAETCSRVNQSRSNSKNAAKRKGAGRGRKNSGSVSAGRRAEKRNLVGSRPKGDGGGSSSQRKNGSENTNQPVTTLENRQEILDSVLQKEDHEYHGFAKYLSQTYELTGNTDRHTSKDYIRLCNLKDDYHKQCASEKDKLKIYRIKTFFSKILKLMVTGEWDRHNHGGVRGPYVYGIRLRNTGDSSQDGAKSRSSRGN